MAPQVAYVSKTQHYLKVKKPLLERQRRARFNKCLDALKTLVAEFQHDDAILRMDKAEMLEAAIVFMRAETQQPKGKNAEPELHAVPTMDGFRNGYMNAVNEVSRVMAAMPGMSVNIGKSVMTHLGWEFNRMLRCEAAAINTTTYHNNNDDGDYEKRRTTKVTAPLSPASSGYHSDADDAASMIASPMPSEKNTQSIWRPW